MNLRDIEYFVAVADLAHFGKASEQCCVSQPTLSGQLKKLELELGQTLFDRSTRVVQLSAFGQEILPICRNILTDVDTIVQKSREQQDPFSGPLRLGAFPTLCPWLFPRITPELKRDFPETQFLLLEEKSSVLENLLQNGDLDAAVLSLPVEVQGIECIPLVYEPFMLALPADHVWAASQEIGYEQMSELGSQALLLLDDGHCLRDQALDYCRRYGAGEFGNFRATSIETLRQMVRLGSGMTLIPRFAVPDHDEPGICYKELPDRSAGRELALCFRVTHPRRKFFFAAAERIKGMCLLTEGCVEL